MCRIFPPHFTEENCRNLVGNFEKLNVILCGCENLDEDVKEDINISQDFNLCW